MGKILLLLFIMFTAVPSCQKSGIEEAVSIEVSEDIIDVVNENQPNSLKFRLEFNEELSLYKKEWWPIALLIDKQGNIFVETGPENILLKFSPQGEEIGKKVFPQGQAPGEFNGFDPCLSDDGNLYIADWSQRRLTVFDTHFKMMGVSKLKLYGFIFRLDSENNMYFLSIERIPNTTDRQKLVLTKCSPSGIPLLRFHAYEWGQTRDSNGVYHSDAYRTQLRYKIDRGNNVYFATTDKYEINKISPEGKVVKRISKKGKTRKLSKEERESFQPENPNPRFVTDVPENVPYIADLFILDEDFLLIVTFESDKNEDYLLGDVFDNLGVYMTSVEIPKYSRWDYLMAPCKIGAVCKNGYFYTIESDENEDHFWVKRYKIIIDL